MKSKKNKSERLQLRLTPEDKDLITKNAEKSGMTITDYIIENSKNRYAAYIDNEKIKPITLSNAIVLLTQLINDIDQEYSHNKKIRKELNKIWNLLNIMK